MTTVLVDSNVILDVILGDPNWADWSSDALGEAIANGRTVINPIVYAEISIRYTRIEELDEVLWNQIIEREPLPYEAAFLAGKVFSKYGLRGGKRIAPLADFFIGAHAMVSGYGLLTRNPRHYRRNFPKLTLIAP